MSWLSPPPPQIWPNQGGDPTNSLAACLAVKPWPGCGRSGPTTAACDQGKSCVSGLPQVRSAFRSGLVVPRVDQSGLKVAKNGQSAAKPPKVGKQWPQMSKSAQSWTKVAKTGQKNRGSGLKWANKAKHDEIWPERIQKAAKKEPEAT